jgi:hypothetical protein
MVAISTLAHTMPHRDLVGATVSDKAADKKFGSRSRHRAEATGEMRRMQGGNDLPGVSGVVRWTELSNSEVVRGKRMEESQESALKGRCR